MRMPDWFPADRVYSGRNGWHVGSPSGISIGPYDSEDAARAASFKVRAALARARCPRDQAGLIRRFVREQTETIMAGDPAARVLRVRVGERSKFWPRSNRCFCADGAWFFHTREGIDVGPYYNETELRRDAERLVGMLARMHGDSESARRLAIYEFLRRPRAA